MGADPPNKNKRGRLIALAAVLAFLLPCAWLGSKISVRDAELLRSMQAAGVTSFTPNTERVLHWKIHSRLPVSWRPYFERVEELTMWEETIHPVSTDFSGLRKLDRVSIYGDRKQMAPTPHDYTGCVSLIEVSADEGTGVPILSGCRSLVAFDHEHWSDLDRMPDFSDSPDLMVLSLSWCRFPSLDGLIAPRLSRLKVGGDFTKWPGLHQHPKLEELELRASSKNRLKAGVQPWALPMLSKLSLREIEGTLPSFIGLPALEEIRLEDCEMDSLPSLVDCHRLRELKVLDTELKRLPELAGGLKLLRIDSSSIKDVSVLQGKPVENLSLGPYYGNKGSTLPTPTGWEGVVATRRLHLAHLKMSGPFPTTLVAKTCEIVDLEGVALSEQPDFSGTNLKSLTLSRNGLAVLRGDLLPRSLEKLEVAGFRTIDWAGLPRGLKSLRVLGGDLREIGWESLPRSIEILNLRDLPKLETAISEIRLPRLKELVLDDTKTAPGWIVDSPVLDSVTLWGDFYSEWPVIKGTSAPVDVRAHNNKLLRPSAVHRFGNKTVPAP